MTTARDTARVGNEPPHPVFALRGDGLRLALADADLPALLPALAFLTGDTGILEPALRPAPATDVVGKAPQGGMDAAAQRRGRELA
ncbi:MAG: NAD(P)/FAD-dependent oxidoreductase, partial [Frankiales bacterium]|nr:NAD(P)/FAD-dependent oxidoreductase [Frankiales bacterium]